MLFLETARLVLRQVTEKDIPIMHAYRNDEACARYQRGQSKELAAIQNLVARRRADRLGVEDNCMVAVALQETDEMIGEIVVMPNEGAIALGYTFAPQHHRKGYAFEALSALTAWLHEAYPSWEFVCFTDRENWPSMGLLKKLGYEDMGYLPGKDSQVFVKWAPQLREEIKEAIAARPL